MPEFIPEDNITLKRKRLRFRSWHRGTQEMDILLGKFADAHIASMSDEMLDLYDTFLSQSDPDIYNWVTGQEKVPEEEDNALIRLLLGFYNL